MNNSVTKIFLKKTLRDLKSNIRQFLSIIFIIGIAVTLFVGLQANYQSLNNRVNSMYERGNMSDIYVTYDLFNSEDNDEDNIKELFGYDLNVQSEKRFYFPGKVEGRDTYLCLYNSYPTLNRACNLYVDDPINEGKYLETNKLNVQDDGSFLVIDKKEASMISDLFSGKTYKVGDELTISLDLSTITSEISSDVASMIDTLISLVPEIETYIEPEKIEQFKKELNDFLVGSSFNNVVIKTAVTNFMGHPENISSENGTSPVTLMSFNKIAEYLCNQIATFIENQIPEIDASFVRDLYKSSEGFEFYNQVLFKFNGNKNVDLQEATEKVRTYFNQKSKDTFGNMQYLMNKDNLVSNLSIQNDISQAQTFSWVFPFVFMLVAVLIAITTISQLIIKEHNIIGTIKGLGISNKEIIAHYSLTSFSLGFIGCFIGCLIGPLIIPFILDLKYQMLYSLPATTYEFPILAALLTTATVIAIILIITRYILGRELKISPAASMLPITPRIKFKAKKKMNKPRFTSIKIALRNIKVYFTKSLMVVIGVMGCEALMICGFGIEDTVNFGIDHDISKYYGADIILSYNSKNASLEEKIVNDTELNNIGKIEKSYPLYNLIGSVSYNNGPVFDTNVVLATDEAYNDSVIDMDFPLNTVAITTGMADDLGVKESDLINIKINNKEVAKKVGLVFEYFSIHAIYGHSSDTDLKDFTTAPTALYLYTDVSTDRDKLNQMSDYILKNYEEISSANSSFAQRERIAKWVESVNSMTNTIKVFALLLAGVCLLNLALLNFKERTREIATLKVLGLNNFEIGRSLIYESLILTAVGALIGLSLGFPMLFAVLNTNKNALVSFIYFISVFTYILSTAICIVTAFVVNLVLATRIRKVPMVESLKSVE